MRATSVCTSVGVATGTLVADGVAVVVAIATYAAGAVGDSAGWVTSPAMISPTAAMARNPTTIAPTTNHALLRRDELAGGITGMAFGVVGIVIVVPGVINDCKATDISSADW